MLHDNYHAHSFPSFVLVQYFLFIERSVYTEAVCSLVSVQTSFFLYNCCYLCDVTFLGCPLKGQKIFTLQNGSVLCEEHYRQLLLTQQQQHTGLRRNQPLPYPTSQSKFMSHVPSQSSYPYKLVPTKPSNTYTMV